MCKEHIILTVPIFKECPKSHLPKNFCSPSDDALVVTALCVRIKPEEFAEMYGVSSLFQTPARLSVNELSSL